jgi:plasmid stabilization system protein ParE
MVEIKKNIQWSSFALKNIKEIHNFYLKTASKKVANKIVDEIFHHVKTLQTTSYIGQEEILLNKLNQKHRDLVIHHCKIIYRIENDTVFITHVFDTRQHPNKLK